MSLQEDQDRMVDDGISKKGRIGQKQYHHPVRVLIKGIVYSLKILVLNGPWIQEMKLGPEPALDYFQILQHISHHPDKEHLSSPLTFQFKLIETIIKAIIHS